MTEEKILLGMTRPTWPLPCIGKGYVLCSCTHILQTVEALQSHWQMGHFDTPVYATKQEMIDRIIEKNSVPKS